MIDLPTGFSTMTSAIEFADRYNLWILNKMDSFIGKNLLEIGTGQGNFKRYLRHTYESYISIDINNEVINRAQARDPEGLYFRLDIAMQNDMDKINDHNVDTIICLNVLEHIPDDVSALVNMASILQTNGHLLLFAPAFQFLYSDIDHLAGHCRRYTKSDIIKRVKDLDLEILVLEYFNPIGGLGWLINKVLKHDNLNSKSLNSQIRFFDRYMVPVSQFLNPLTKRIFGQSILCVMKKL